MPTHTPEGEAHLRRCADRALEEYDNNGFASALASAMTDFREHPLTSRFPDAMLMAILGPAARAGREQLEEAIMGFNV